jgi:hypothetical protein
VSGADFMIEQAEARVAVEVSHRIEVVSGLVAPPGRECCIDCDEPISEARRSAAPFAQAMFRVPVSQGERPSMKHVFDRINGFLFHDQVRLIEVLSILCLARLLAAIFSQSGDPGAGKPMTGSGLCRLPVGPL